MRFGECGFARERNGDVTPTDKGIYFLAQRIDMNLSYKNFLATLPAVVLYVLACVTPAVDTWSTNNHEAFDMYGFMMLIAGPLGLFSGHIGWLANPLMFVVAFFLISSRYRCAGILCAVALVLALTAPFTLKMNPLPANEGGVGELRLRSLDLGFYLWISSIVALGVAIIVRFRLAASPDDATNRASSGSASPTAR